MGHWELRVVSSWSNLPWLLQKGSVTLGLPRVYFTCAKDQVCQLSHGVFLAGGTIFCLMAGLCVHVTRFYWMVSGLGECRSQSLLHLCCLFLHWMMPFNEERIMLFMGFPSKNIHSPSVQYTFTSWDGNWTCPKITVRIRDTYWSFTDIFSSAFLF